MISDIKSARENEQSLSEGRGRVGVSAAFSC